MKRHALFLLLLLAFVSIPGSAVASSVHSGPASQGGEATPSSSLLSLQESPSLAEMYRLGEAFMARREWFRAATMFQAMGLSSTGPTSQWAWIRAGDAHLEARQWERAADQFLTAMELGAVHEDLARLRLGQSYFQGKQFDLSARVLAELIGKKQLNAALQTEAGAYFTLANVEQAAFPTAAAGYRGLAGFISDLETQQSLGILAARADEAHNLPHRSPTAASLMSALLPGLGQAYTGSWGEAGLAFAANAIMGLLIWDSVLKAKDFDRLGIRGWPYTSTVVYSMLGSSFYFGNIYGAAAGAIRFNKRQIAGLQRELKDATFQLPLFEYGW